MKIKIRSRDSKKETKEVIESGNDANLKTYLLLDAAKMRDRIEEAKRFNPEHECLYKGEAAENLHQVAPWMFSFPKPSLLSDWYLANMGNQHWGMLIQSKADFKSIYLHLKKFLMVKTEAGEKMYFRFYDPRVLPTFLETADERQLNEFFGPIDKFILETDKRELIEYQLVQNELVTNKSNYFNEVSNA